MKPKERHSQGFQGSCPLCKLVAVFQRLKSCDTSCFMINTFPWSSNLEPVLGLTMNSLYPSPHRCSCTHCMHDPHVQTAALSVLCHLIRKLQAYEVFVLNSSWTLMNYDNHLTVNNICFQERNREIVFEMKKIAALVWLYHTSWWFTYHDRHVLTSVDLLFLCSVREEC